MRHIATTRSFGPSGGMLQPVFTSHPIGGGALVINSLPVGVNGEPYNGMDPSAPATWVRPWNPQPGMIQQLNFDGAKYQGNTPMGGTWHYPRPVRDRRLSRKWGRGRRLWLSAGSSCITGSGARQPTTVRRWRAAIRLCPGRCCFRWRW